MADSDVELWNHPYSVVRLLRYALPHLSVDAVVEFGVYRYVKSSLLDERRILHVPLRELTGFRVHSLIQSLQDGEELALHSRITRIGGEVMHLPMIDFATSDSAMALAVTRSLLHELHLPEPYLFSSGRSFHGYCPVLLSADSWRIFMGALLLLNPDSGREVVDHRWVGHRLMAGYGALRWSWNTDQYVSYPGPRLANRPAFRRIAPNE